MNINRLRLGKATQRRFATLLRGWMKSTGATQGELGELTGIRREHLNKLLNGNADRHMSGRYAAKIIDAGIVDLADVYRLKRVRSRERSFWESMLLIDRIYKEKGVSVYQILQDMYPDIKTD